MTTRGMAQEAEPAVSFAIPLQILPGVLQPDLMLLQEAVKFVARFKAQKAAQLSGSELALAVSFESNGFESGAGEILAGSSQGNGKLVGQIERKLHEY